VEVLSIEPELKCGKNSGKNPSPGKGDDCNRTENQVAVLKKHFFMGSDAPTK
jgi:hypothetical protein